MASTNSGSGGRNESVYMTAYLVQISAERAFTEGENKRERLKVK